jgi:hypothetical protein
MENVSGSIRCSLSVDRLDTQLGLLGQGDSSADDGDMTSKSITAISQPVERIRGCMSGSETSGCNQPVFPVGVTHGTIGYPFSTRGGMDELTVAGIDCHVRDWLSAKLEKQQITRSEIP